jgi:predicted transcriptional regulator
MIFDAAATGEIKTKIMLQANLNHIQIKRYIPSLLSQKLIKHRIDISKPSQVYTTTEKGHSFFRKVLRGPIVKSHIMLYLTLRQNKNA